GSAAFQEYIKDPKRYRGDKRSKAHTPLSMVCALAYGRENGWDWRRRLAVAMVAACHHGGVKTKGGLEGVVADKDHILEEQVRSLDWDALDAALGVPNVRLPACAGEDLCADVLDDLGTLFEELDAYPTAFTTACCASWPTRSCWRRTRRSW